MSDDLTIGKSSPWWEAAGKLLLLVAGLAAYVSAQGDLGTYLSSLSRLKTMHILLGQILILLPTATRITENAM